MTNLKNFSELSKELQEKMSLPLKERFIEFIFGECDYTLIRKKDHLFDIAYELTSCEEIQQSDFTLYLIVGAYNILNDVDKTANAEKLTDLSENTQSLIIQYFFPKDIDELKDRKAELIEIIHCFNCIIDFSSTNTCIAIIKDLYDLLSLIEADYQKNIIPFFKLNQN